MSVQQPTVEREGGGFSNASLPNPPILNLFTWWSLVHDDFTSKLDSECKQSIRICSMHAAYKFHTESTAYFIIIFYNNNCLLISWCIRRTSAQWKCAGLLGGNKHTVQYLKSRKGLLQYFQQKPYFVYVKFLSRNVWMAKRIFRKFEKKTDSYMNRKKISIYIYMYVSLISITVTLEFINVYGKK